MNAGFDAKRAYHNNTGLGEYSRNLLQALASYYPGNQYYLFNPKPSSFFSPLAQNMHQVLPGRFLDRIFSSAWRSHGVARDLDRLRIDLYHGLSHEIPLGIHRSGPKTVVTIHDLIYERFPAQYNPIDVRIYRKKSAYACAHASMVVAISEQTKKDIMRYFGTPEERIAVCYQSCNPSFSEVASGEQKQKVKDKYGLPDEFFLYVGSVIERKNLLNICKAVLLLEHELNIPLVVIGNGKRYMERVKAFVKENRLEQRVIFISADRPGTTASSFIPACDMPAVYQQAIAMIYPSFFEGFGLPVQEALCSGLPVITSNLSSLPEAGGEGSYYVDPSSPAEIAGAMKKISSDRELASSMISKGRMHAQNFTAQKCAASVMQVYQKLCYCFISFSFIFDPGYL